MKTFKKTRPAFSLIELVGVIAVIAILAAIIAPRVVETIKASRITQSIASINAVKTAAVDFTAKYSVIPTTDAESRFDDLLVTSGLLDGRFRIQVGAVPGTENAGDSWTWNASTGVWSAGSDGATQAGLSRIVALSSATTDPSASAGANFHLDGASDLPTGAVSVAAILESVPATDALEISTRLDGPGFSASDAATKDDTGRVAYAAPVDGVTDVYVYLLHR